MIHPNTSTLPLSYQRFFLPPFTSSRLNDSGVNKVGVPPLHRQDGRTDGRGAHTRSRRSSARRSPCSVPFSDGGEGGESTERAARLHFFTAFYPQRVRRSPGWRNTSERMARGSHSKSLGSSIWRCKPSWPLLPCFLPELSPLDQI